MSLTDEELRALEGDTSIPPPSAEVVARAQEILRTGAIPQHSDELTAKELDVDVEDRIQLVRHMLTQQPFTKTYTIFKDAEVVFQTVSVQLEELVSAVVLATERPEISSLRAGRYAEALAVASMKRVSYKGVPNSLAVFDVGKPLDHNAKVWTAWCADHSTTLVLLIKKLHAEFRQHIAALLAKADDPSFWQTQ